MRLLSLIHKPSYIFIFCIAKIIFSFPLSVVAFNIPKQEIAKPHIFAKWNTQSTKKSNGKDNFDYRLSASILSNIFFSLIISLNTNVAHANPQSAASMDANNGPLATMIVDETNMKNIKVWQLNNGEVKLPDPLIIRNNDDTNKLILEQPTLLGSGGGGGVFSFHSRNSIDSNDNFLAVKVSWLGSSESVEKECNVLQFLSNTNTRNIEKCIAQMNYPYDTRRVMIVLSPVISNDPVSTLSKIESKLQPYAVKSVIGTLIDMLSANVITVDVQPLISQQTGDVVFIDFTEAQFLSSKQPPTFLDLAQISAFCAEMMALIPSESIELQKLASISFLHELKSAEVRGVKFSDEIYTIFSNQSILMSSPDTLAYIESKLDS